MFKYVPLHNNRKFHHILTCNLTILAAPDWNFPQCILLLLGDGTYLNITLQKPYISNKYIYFCLLFLRISWQIYDFYRDGFRYVHIEIHLLQMHIFKPNFLNCTDLRNYYISNSVSILLLHIFKHNLVITTDLKMTYNSQLHI